MTEERIYQKYYDDLSADEVDLLVRDYAARVMISFGDVFLSRRDPPRGLHLNIDCALSGLTVRLFASVLDGYYLPKFVEAFKALGLMFYGVEKDSCGMLKATFFISAYYIFKAELDKGGASGFDFIRRMAEELTGEVERA